MSGLPRLALTIGDPAGCGPELVAAALASRSLRARAELVVVGDRRVVEAALARRRRPPPSGFGVHATPTLTTAAEARAAMAAGAPTLAGGRVALDAIEAATDLALAGRVDAVVTAPISKEAIAAAGCVHPGHTELIAERAGADVVMAFFAGGLRTALATTHIALRDVPSRLDAGRIGRAGFLLDQALRRHEGIAAPRIAVCALNPHAGEGGLFGDEEPRLIRPAVEALRVAGVDASGPLPADTVFARARAGEFDAVVALYHDQALIPLKLLGRGTAVNVTLGLPFVRTSPDHGTAYDAVAAGTVEPRPFRVAASLAADLAAAR